MLGREGLLQHLTCPFYENGLCERPYCHFSHGQPKPPPGLGFKQTLLPTPPGPVVTSTTSPSPLDVIGGYMGLVGTSYTAPPPFLPPTMPPAHSSMAMEEGMSQEDQFVGYTGYFADRSVGRQVSVAANLKVPSPPPVVKPVSPKKSGLLGDRPKPASKPEKSGKVGSFVEKAPPGGSGGQRPSFTNIVKELSDIDREIAKVQRQIKEKNFDVGDSEGYDPEEKPTTSKSEQKKSVKFGASGGKNAASSSKMSSVPTYVPTPISELQIRKEQKQKEATERRLYSEKLKAEKRQKLAQQTGSVPSSTKGSFETTRTAQPNPILKNKVKVVGDRKDPSVIRPPVAMVHPQKKEAPTGLKRKSLHSAAPKQDSTSANNAVIPPKRVYVDSAEQVSKRKKSKGITHKLDEQFVKHEVSEFSMEWNPNVELSNSFAEQNPSKHLKKDKKREKVATTTAEKPKKMKDLFGLDSEDEEDSRDSQKSSFRPPAASTSSAIPEFGGRRSADAPSSSSAGNPDGDWAEEFVSDFVTEIHTKTEEKRNRKRTGSGKEEPPPPPPPDPDSLIALGKPRMAHLASHDVTSLRQKASGAPKAHLVTPKDQLEMRYKGSSVNYLIFMKHHLSKFSWKKEKLQKAKEEKLAIQEKLAERHRQQLRLAAEGRAGAGDSERRRPPWNTQNSSSVGRPGDLQMHREGALAATPVKGEKRVAHVPKAEPVEERVKKPTLAPDTSSKVPTPIRQRYLNLFADEYLQLNQSLDEAYDMAQEEEKLVSERTSSKIGYMSAAVSVIKRLREQKLQIAPEFVPNRKCHPALSLSHQQVLDGKSGVTHSYTVKRTGSQSVEGVIKQEAFFHENLTPYILTWEQLDANGFPRPHPNHPSTPVFRRSELSRPGPKLVPDDDLTRNCCRCGKQYRLNVKGGYVVKEDCVYHWGKAWKRKGSSGTLETRYTCCGADNSSLGCALADHHVSDVIRQSDLEGFIQTRPLSPSTSSEDSRLSNVLALDCEMVYTAWGTTALARVSVVNWRLESVFEALVRPDIKVVDCNSRFSGLKMEDLEAATTTLRDVQDRLMGLISAETILMGHSLEGDLRALKIVHEKVVDTSVVFPHRLGPPYKRALKTLMAEVLQKRIQEDDDGHFGHDSKEDAAACMELMVWKVKEDLKLT